MAIRHYDWVCGGKPPLLLRHSEVKHSLLRDYLVDYFLTLVSSPRQDKIKLTIVDGFCGGGRYLNENGSEVPGSPIVILRAIKEAHARVLHTQQRAKPVEFDVELICIDEDIGAINHLKWVLEDEGYGELLRKYQIRLINGRFDEHSESVIKYSVERSVRSGKAIFVLDQYGYSDVPMRNMQKIFATLAKAEVILTFNVDSLINFLSLENLSNFEQKTGFDGALTASDLDEINRGPQWRRQIQAKLFAKVTQGSGARHFTPFFIRPVKGHGDFWLLHLSQHSKARDVMAEAHWRYNNHFVHYGQAGLDMFGVGYAAKIDDAGLPQSSFNFDDVALDRSHSAMLCEIPSILSKKCDGILFGDFFTEICNQTPATRRMIEQSTLSLVKEGQIEIADKDGGKLRITAAIKNDHVIRIPSQKRFFF